MATILPEPDSAVPLGSIPATVSSTPAAPAKPPRQKRKQRPKLTVADVTTASAIHSALSIGRRVAARGIPEPGREGPALNSLLRNMRRWAADVAPDYDVAEFVVAAQALAGKRELRPVLANLRLAELRQVTGGWEELQIRKRMARKGKNKIREEEEEDQVEGREHDGDPGESPANGDGKHVENLMQDPEVKKRIERNRQIALQRRLKAVGGASRGDGNMRTACADHMDIDPHDIVETGPYDEQEDIDMDILDQMEDWGRAEVTDANRGENREGKGARADAAPAEGGFPAESEKSGPAPAEKNREEKDASEEDADKIGEAVAVSGVSEARKAREPTRPEVNSSPRCSEAAVASEQGGESMTDGGNDATMATDNGSDPSPTAVAADRETEQAILSVDAAMPKDVAGQEGIAERKDAGRKNVTDQKSAVDEEVSGGCKDVAQQKDAEEETHEDVDMDILGEFEATKDEEY